MVTYASLILVSDYDNKRHNENFFNELIDFRYFLEASIMDWTIGGAVKRVYNCFLDLTIRLLLIITSETVKK